MPGEVLVPVALHLQRLLGRPMLLIDNVATSGATLDATATGLKAAGAITVWRLMLDREI